ncbi:MAG: hypothetical protein M9927_17550 [Anaerolineae bacterium]|nr:hypothetical protein [Anaerolineae bacterium]
MVCSTAASLPEVVGDAAVSIDPLRVDSLAQGLRRCWATPVCATTCVHAGCAGPHSFPGIAALPKHWPFTLRRGRRG